VGRKGAAGEVHLAESECWPIDTTYYVKAPQNWSIRFHYYLLKCLRLDQHDRSTAIPGLNRNDAYGIEIPVPPLPTQHRIVEKIEELFSELDHGVESLKKAQKQLRTYRQAVLKDAFEGKLTKEWREQQSDLPTPEELLEQIKAEREAHRERELAEWEKEVEQWVKDGKMGRKPTKPAMSKNVDVLRKEEIKSLPKLPEKWSWIRLGNLSNDIQIGPFGSLLHKSEYIADGIPVINPSNIKDERISPDLNITISDEKFSELTKYKLKEGNVIIGRRGEMGRSALVTYKEDGWLCGTGSLFVKLNKYSNPSFITKYVRSKFFIDYLDNNARGTTMKNLNASILSNSPVPLLSREEQNEIVSEIESRLSVVNQLEQTINENLQKAEALRQSILKKAFNGRLIRN
jgi:type I restriction enzyme, S subunit